MAKELPFFKFIATEWLTGDINFEPFDIQGLFINVCATYWKEDCVITLTRLKQRLSNAEAQQWQQLIDGKYIKVINDQVYISFLDEQLEELSEQRRKKQEAGSKGGKASVKQRLSTAQATLKHKDIDRDKDKEVDTDSNIPALKEFVAYGLEQASKNKITVTETALSMKYEAWKLNGWVNGNGNKIKNWKSSLINTLPYIKESVKGLTPKEETEEDAKARVFMETVKAYNTHKTLYGEESANEKFKFNDHVQPSNNNNRIA